jgi:hypothetical protein
MIFGMPGGISSAIWLGCDDEKRRVIVSFNTRIGACQKIAPLSFPQLLHQSRTLARGKLGMKGVVRV